MICFVNSLISSRSTLRGFEASALVFKAGVLISRKHYFEMSFEILLAILINYLGSDDLHAPGMCLDEESIAKLHCTSHDSRECLKSHKGMRNVKIRAAVLSYFKTLPKHLCFLMHGMSRHINLNPAVFYCIRQTDERTVMHYKVTISKDGKKLNVKSYVSQRRYNMDLELFETTDRRNFSGRLFCKFMGSKEPIEKEFKIMRRSPALFNEILDYYRPSNIPNPFSNKTAPVTWD
jgi:hypothetical protein